MAHPTDRRTVASAHERIDELEKRFKARITALEAAAASPQPELPRTGEIAAAGGDANWVPPVNPAPHQVAWAWLVRVLKLDWREKAAALSWKQRCELELTERQQAFWLMMAYLLPLLVGLWLLPSAEIISMSSGAAAFHYVVLVFVLIFEALTAFILFLLTVNFFERRDVRISDSTGFIFGIALPVPVYLWHAESVLGFMVIALAGVLAVQLYRFAASNGWINPETGLRRNLSWIVGRDHSLLAGICALPRTLGRIFG